MSPHYRAIWRDDRPDQMEQALETLQTWITGKQLSLKVPPEGYSNSDEAEIEIRRAEDNDARVLRASITEHGTPNNGYDRLITTATWITEAEKGWVWIDVEHESTDMFSVPPAITAPDLVVELLNQRNGQNAKTPLGPEPLVVTSDEIDNLNSTLFDPARTVPVVLFSADTYITAEQSDERVRCTAEALAGCADVRMLTPDSEEAFNAALPDTSLKIYRGSVRVYVPTMTESDPKPYRHQYILSDRLTNSAPIASRRISQMVLPMMAAQSPPTVYRTRLKSIIYKRDWEQYANEQDEELTRLNHQNEDLKLELALAADDIANSERDIERLSRRNEILRMRLRELQEQPETLELEVDNNESPRTCSDAVAMAQSLTNIEIHSDAPVELERLDESENSRMWATRIWRHLNSLNAYAEEKGAGFVNWCETSGNDRVIGSKFIAMKESQTVMNNPVLRRYRCLPVSQEIDPSGYIEMEAHLKPVEGGGMQIPRIYFHDDTKGSTGKVHIGFIGPHDSMPNLSTN